MNSSLLKQALKFSGLFLLALGTLRAEPTAPEILARVKTLIQAQTAAVQGKLRTGAETVPFSLHQADGASVYQFQNPAETIRVTFGDVGSQITGVDDPKKFVRGSILSYDDLALRFLYWTDTKILGSEKIRSLPCWQLRLAPPSRQSTYGVVHLWVNKQSGAFLRADAFDWNGDRIRRFEVLSTQQIDGRLMLKKMRIEDLKSAEPRITYLEISDPAK